MKKFEARLLQPAEPLSTYAIVFLLFLAIITLVNIPFITMPPVWDAAGGVFAPAIYLYESRFDFAGLLQQDGFVTGGPNVHSITLVTFLTYFIISLSNARPELFLPLLHFSQFAFAGIVLTGTFFMALRLLGLLAAGAVSLAVLFYPLFLVQTGYLYLEIPGAACFIAGSLAWALRYYLSAILSAVAACLIKSFGMVLIGALIFLILFESSLSKMRKFLYVGAMIFLTAAIEIIKWSTARGVSFEKSQYFSYFQSIFFKLDLLPDLKVLITLALIVPCILRLRTMTDRKDTLINAVSKLVSGDSSQRLVTMIYLLPLVYFGFIITVPLAGMNYTQLPRYFVWILPFLFVGSAYGCQLFFDCVFKSDSNASIQKGELLLTMLLVALCGFFIANRDGRFYPSLDGDLNSFSSAERSYEYLDFYKIQRDSVAGLAELQKGLPAFVTRGEYYYLSSPLMGYVKRQPDHIFLIVNEPYGSAAIDHFPEDFLLLNVSTQPLHGGKVVKEILRKARANPAYAASELAQFNRGPYSSSIVRISRTSGPR